MFAVLTRLRLKGRLRAEGDGSLSPRLLPIEKIMPEKTAIPDIWFSMAVFMYLCCPEVQCPGFQAWDFTDGQFIVLESIVRVSVPGISVGSCQSSAIPLEIVSTEYRVLYSLLIAYHYL